MPPAGSEETLLSCERLSKRYGDRWAVRDLSLAVHPGEIVGLIGPNGAGKSTTFKSIVGIVRPTAGRIRVCGRDATSRPVDARRRIGYMPGETRLYGTMRGLEYLRFALGFYPDVDWAYVGRLAERLEVPLRQRIRTSSSGMKQRLALLAALGARPPLLLLDEPTRGMDPVLQREFASLLDEAGTGGAAVLLSSHVLAEVEQICTRFEFLQNGRLLDARDVRALRDGLERLFELRLAHDGPLEEWARRDFDLLRRTGRTVWLRSNIPFPEALGRIGELPVEALRYGEGKLEDLYLALYGKRAGDAGR